MNDTMQVQIIDVDGIFDATIEYRDNGKNILVYPHGGANAGSTEFVIKMVKQLCNGEMIIKSVQDGDNYTFVARKVV